MTITHSEIYTDSPRRRLRITVGANQTTPWYPVSAHGGNVAVRPTSGTIRAETTSSPLSVVNADNQLSQSNAIARSWPPGDVTAADDAEFGFATAIRFVSVGAGGVADIAE